MDNIKMDLRDRMGWYGLDRSAQDRHQWKALVRAVMNIQVP
jgi:hypothetical protein